MSSFTDSCDSNIRFHSAPSAAPQYDSNDLDTPKTQDNAIGITSSSTVADINLENLLSLQNLLQWC